MAINERGGNFSNLSSNQREALKNLKRYKDIVIKEADKGGGVVVWGRKDYCREAYNHLNDEQVYEVIESDPTDIVISRVEKALDSLVRKGYLTSDNRKYLVVSKPGLGKFYLLLKIYKRLQNVPGRPIISNGGTATERISDFLDFHLQPLVHSVPSIIKDTTDFLQKLENLGNIPSAVILCAIDVVGLYPHITHVEGLSALLKALNTAECELPVEDLVSLARLVLEINYFEFDEKIFRQNLAAAIGTKFAQGFANIFMVYGLFGRKLFGGM